MGERAGCKAAALHGQAIFNLLENSQKMDWNVFMFFGSKYKSKLEYK